MTQLEIYKKEVELACKREREAENNPNGWSYGCSCYESALKALNLYVMTTIADLVGL